LRDDDRPFAVDWPASFVEAKSCFTGVGVRAMARKATSNEDRADITRKVDFRRSWNPLVQII
jgi:hypothetical protein